MHSLKAVYFFYIRRQQLFTLFARLSLARAAPRGFVGNQSSPSALCCLANNAGAQMQSRKVLTKCLFLELYSCHGERWKIALISHALRSCKYTFCARLHARETNLFVLGCIQGRRALEYTRKHVCFKLIGHWPASNLLTKSACGSMHVECIEFFRGISNLERRTDLFMLVKCRLDRHTKAQRSTIC